MQCVKWQAKQYKKNKKLNSLKGYYFTAPDAFTKQNKKQVKNLFSLYW